MITHKRNRCFQGCNVLVLQFEKKAQAQQSIADKMSQSTIKLLLFSVCYHNLHLKIVWSTTGMRKTWKRQYQTWITTNFDAAAEIQSLVNGYYDTQWLYTTASELRSVSITAGRCVAWRAIVTSAMKVLQPHFNALHSARYCWLSLATQHHAQP